MMTLKNADVSAVEKFDKLLVQVIDQVIRYSLGDVNASTIYNYLEKKKCPLEDIPNNLEVFSMELRNLLGSGRGQILGSAVILEKAILKAFCIKLGLKYNLEGPIVFADCIRELREAYNHGKQTALQSCHTQ